MNLDKGRSFATLQQIRRLVGACVLTMCHLRFNQRSAWEG